MKSKDASSDIKPITVLVSQEIINLFIDELRDCFSALKTCSLVHPSWLPKARAHLFHAFTVGFVPVIKYPSRQLYESDYPITLIDHLNNAFFEHISSSLSFQNCVQILTFTDAMDSRLFVVEPSGRVFTDVLPFTNLRVLELNRSIWPKIDIVPPVERLISRNHSLSRIIILGLRVGGQKPISNMIPLVPENIDAGLDLIKSISKHCPQLKDLWIQTKSRFIDSKHDTWTEAEEMVRNDDIGVCNVPMPIQRLIIQGYGVQLLKLLIWSSATCDALGWILTDLDTGVLEGDNEFEVNPEDWPNLKNLRIQWYSNDELMKNPDGSAQAVKHILIHLRSTRSVNLQGGDRVHHQLNELSLLLNSTFLPGIENWCEVVFETTKSIVEVEPQRGFVKAIRIMESTGGVDQFSTRVHGTEISINNKGQDWEWF
ncbi:hypothetical protein J3R30DRAFT_3697295 [Lentinula aciculospora]|uniref:Uncharacterized protein n=1 Tax=Lentinula aciculospora TaxID=153920 RepID=A0A9W9ALN4_9AGAR|nr:hypothetical protein J3R30DRAFT_3697295 [Lentinula aciculospora]